MQIKCRSMEAEKSVGGPVTLINTSRAGMHCSTPAQSFKPSVSGAAQQHQVSPAETFSAKHSTTRHCGVATPSTLSIQCTVTHMK